MPRYLSTLLGLSAALAFAGRTIGETSDPADRTHEKLEFFEKKIRPVLVDHCYSCHSADTKPAGGLRVDDRNGLLNGGDAGPAVVPGEPEKGTLLQRIRSDDPKRRMPKEGELLTESQTADLEAWIKDGAVWPPEKLPASLTRVRPDYAELKTNHWAWQPLKDPAVPSNGSSKWPWTSVDRFILAKLAEKQLKPVADAEPVTLLRRVTYDLTGLPPTPEDIRAFKKDSSRKAFAKMVDRLLDSPAYSERWGRYWLDIARYGESTGPSRNIPYPHAWKYRDYVLDAVGKDVPYDRFIQEQIAGDLLPAANAEERDRLLTATGFLALGVKDVNQRFKTRFVMDNVDEQIDVVTRATLGVTVSCARCHDHKFDPIPISEYYSLAGIFTSTENAAGVRNKMGGGGLDYYDPDMLVKLDTSKVPPPPQDKVDALKAKVEEAKKAWDAIRGTPEGLALGTNGLPKQRPFRVEYEKLRGELLALTDPVNRGYAVHGVREGKAIGDAEIRIRGEAERLGPVVPRGFLSLFEVPGAPKINPAQSGRLELAQWLTHPANPLTPRVAVNRVWQNLFGEGLVNTTDNFGVKGDRPTNPELLDHLANEFIRGGWSTKKLIRTLVLSHAYQLGFDVPEGYREVDPANRLVWRHSPRRLSAEEIRDAVLASAGTLQPKPTGGSVARALPMIEMGDTGEEAKRMRAKADESLFRSVYLPLLRGVTPRSLEPFDPVDQTLVSARREATTVPTQALYLLNSPFVRQQSLNLADRILAEKRRSDERRLEKIYQLTLGRNPNKLEVQRARKYLAEYQTAFADAATANPALLASRDRFKPAPASTETKVQAPDQNPNANPAPAGANATVPVNPDDVPRPVETAQEDRIRPGDARSAAWASLVQALYASAEFRFVR
ncbi:MAG: PSD1 domain-containing protein [Verrucomicrobiales bacterium]|nr:PSD1 domain-containing protein [Verrucomicrobiales bacterium]